MRAIAWRRNAIDLAWVAFTGLNLAAMSLWPNWETIPFHFVWISLTLLYGFRVWEPAPTGFVLGLVILATGSLISTDAFEGTQLWGELFEVPLMSAMFLAMVWHARRRQAALFQVEAIAESKAALLERQESFLHDVSHELRTPVTIARGHLELMGRDNPGSHDLQVALDELGRIERIIARLLLLAKAERPDFLVREWIDVEPFLEEVFTRWSDVIPRGWRLGPVAAGTIVADEEALRTALDALLENAVKYTEPSDWIELRSAAAHGELVIDVRDGGVGVPAEALAHIFDRFARVDDARSRELGGAGLGLAIVSAIVQAHRGACSAQSLPRGTAFSLRLPGFVPAASAAVIPVHQPT
jgi:signal transduction histidine kinase